MIPIRLSLILILLFGLGYPLLMTGVAQVLFPHQANGSLMTDPDGKVIGSELIGQSFQDDRFFHGRISSIDYDAGASGSNNYAPSNPEMIERTKKAIRQVLKENPGAQPQDVPIDLVTNSGSGLDPHISPEAARFQIPRIAQATGIPEEKLNDLVNKHVEGRTWGIFGEPRVNVLMLNRDLMNLMKH